MEGNFIESDERVEVTNTEEVEVPVTVQEQETTPGPNQVKEQKTTQEKKVVDITFHYPIDYKEKYDLIKSKLKATNNKIICYLMDFYLDNNGKVNNNDAKEISSLKSTITELEEKISQLEIDNNNYKSSNLDYKTALSEVNNSDNVIVRLSPIERKLFDEVLKRLSEKYGIEVNKSDYLRTLFLRYNIERWTVWFHNFVLSDKDIENITGISKTDWIKFLNK